MNDRFKFRVWKGQENRMVYEVTYLNPLILDTSIKEENKHNILMQCTGLKDKNGTLIFEGDIVKKQEWQDEYKLGVVFWDDMWGYFDVTKMSMFSLVNRAEVIGNIYENEELLNEQL